MIIADLGFLVCSFLPFADIVPQNLLKNVEKGFVVSNDVPFFFFWFYVAHINSACDFSLIY